jgi:hypothetical protein
MCASLSHFFPHMRVLSDSKLCWQTYVSQGLNTDCSGTDLTSCSGYGLSGQLSFCTQSCISCNGCTGFGISNNGCWLKAVTGTVSLSGSQCYRLQSSPPLPPPSPPLPPPPPPSPPPVASPLQLPGTACFGLAHRYFNGTSGFGAGSALVADAVGGWAAVLSGTSTISSSGAMNTGTWGWAELQLPTPVALGLNGFSFTAWVYPFSRRSSFGSNSGTQLTLVFVGLIDLSHPTSSQCASCQ